MLISMVLCDQHFMCIFHISATVGIKKLSSHFNSKATILLIDNAIQNSFNQCSCFLFCLPLWSLSPSGPLYSPFDAAETRSLTLLYKVLPLFSYLTPTMVRLGGWLIEPAPHSDEENVWKEECVLFSWNQLSSLPSSQSSSKYTIKTSSNMCSNQSNQPSKQRSSQPSTQPSPQASSSPSIQLSSQPSSKPPSRLSA